MSPTANALWMGAGGLSLFLFGMLQMSDSLKAAAGERFRRAMGGLTRNKLRGYALGTAMGTAVHSSATTVMTIGLLNAGLLSLTGAIPVIAGANVGTSLAMQLFAFDIGWLWAALASLGLLLRLLPGPAPRRGLGTAMIGMGLLFLGMQLMSQSVHPFRADLAAWMDQTTRDDGSGFLLALVGAIAFTALIQSSGATIGLLFALAGAGVLTDIRQAIPFIIGAQIGTCTTALISSVGTNADARRGALAHLLFNLITAGLSIAMLPWLIAAIQHLDGSLTRQIAHAHTLMLLGGGVVLVPLTGLFARLLTWIARFPERESDRSQLDEAALDDPPAALLCARRELVRAARIVRRGFTLNRKLLAEPDRSLHQEVKRTEASMDLIYAVMRDYLLRLAARVQDTRLGAEIQWLNLSLIYVERISDHNDNLADLSMDVHHRLSGEDRVFAKRVGDDLYRSVEPLLASVEASWSPDLPHDLTSRARTLREHRARYLPESENLQAELVRRIAAGSLKPLSGFVLTEYISEMDRIVRHTKKIAGVLEKSDTQPGPA